MHVLNNFMNRVAVVQNKMLTLPARKHVRLSARDSQMQRMMMQMLVMMMMTMHMMLIMMTSAEVSKPLT